MRWLMRTRRSLRGKAVPSERPARTTTIAATMNSVRPTSAARTQLTAWRPMECRLILMMMATRRTHEPCGFYLASYTRQPLCRIRRH
jgi:hypothetical protein